MRCNLLEVEHALAIGLFVDAIQRRHFSRLDMARDSFVSRQHELFDDAMRHVTVASGDAGHLARQVQHNVALRHVEVNRAALGALAVQD